MERAGLFGLAGRTAVITGAGSGIGRALSIALASRKCHLALADVSETGLQQTIELLNATDVRVTQHLVDVADPNAVAAFPDQVRDAHGAAAIVINNAGVALGGRFEQIAPTDFEWLMSINFWGTVRMTRAFLPMLREADEARIVNLSSLFGLITPPGQTAYCASKFAVRGFSESLRQELRGSSVGITVVHPGGVATAIARNARSAAETSAEDLARQKDAIERALVLPPAVAAETIVRAIERRQARVLVGKDAKLAAMIERLAPVSYLRILDRISSLSRARVRR